LTADDLWRTYNPNHDFVVDELRPRARLSARRTLRDWLAENPPGSEIFRVREAYLRQAATPEVTAPVDRDALSGTTFGIDLGSTFDGRLFAAFVDSGSAAERSGVLQGDVVLTIEGRPAGDDVQDAQQRLGVAWAARREINLSVERGGDEVFVVVE